MQVSTKTLATILVTLEYAHKALSMDKLSMEAQTYTGAKCIHALLQLQTELGIEETHATGDAPTPRNTFIPELEPMTSTPPTKRELEPLAWDLVT